MRCLQGSPETPCAVARNRSLIALACFLVLSCSPADSIPDEWTLGQRLEQIDQLLANWQAEGASGVVYVSHRGNALYEKGFGSARCDGSEPVTPRHHFLIGSITKAITGLLGYVLQERGMLDLSSALGQYFPSLGDELGVVTLQQLIDHTAGLPDLIDADGREVPYSVAYDYQPVNRDELIAKSAKASLRFEPGSREEYSNLGYQLLAAVYEVATGEEYEALLQRYVFQPGGMGATGYWFADAASREFADGCQRDGDHWGNPIDDAMWGPEGASWNLKGAGGLISTAQSLSRFFEGIGDGVYFKSAEGVEAYKSARMAVSESRQQRVMAPAGSNGIFNAVSVWFDDDRFSIVMITNHARFQAENEMVQQVVRLFPASFMDAM